MDHNFTVILHYITSGMRLVVKHRLRTRQGGVSRGSYEEKLKGQRISALGDEWAYTGVPTHTSLSPKREFSPILFTHPDQHPSAAASDLVSFGGSDDGEMDNSLSLVASDAEELSGSYHSPAPLHSASHPVQAWTLIFSVSCLILWRSWDWNGLPQRNRPVSACMNGSFQGATRPLVNELRHSSQRFTTRSPNHGVHPTHPAYLPLLPPPPLQSTAWNKKDTTTCLTWMSQWPRISAHPQTLAGRQKPLMADPWPV